MANLLNIKRVVSTRAPRIPTIAPDAKTSDKLKKAFDYFRKISDITIEDIFESAKRLKTSLNLLNVLGLQRRMLK